MKRLAIVLVIGTLICGLGTGTAVAHFAASRAASQDLDTAQLSPASTPAATLGTCSEAVGDSIVVSWTATPSSWADGYQVWRSTTSGGPYELIATVQGRDTTSYTDNGLPFDQPFFYNVRATASAWTSAATAEVTTTTRSSTCS